MAEVPQVDLRVRQGLERIVQRADAIEAKAHWISYPFLISKPKGEPQMAISVTAINPNKTIPPGTASGGLHIFSGIVQCVFKGDSNGAVTRDTLTFTVGRVNFPGITVPPTASCTVSLASFGNDGAGNDALWAVDSAQVTRFLNVDSGSGTADVEVVANLAVRGAESFILRVNYNLFYVTS